MNEGILAGSAIELVADMAEETAELRRQLADAQHDLANARQVIIALERRVAELEEAAAWGHRAHQYLLHNIGTIARFGQRLVDNAPKAVKSDPVQPSLFE
jgi:phage-related tail protein